MNTHNEYAIDTIEDIISETHDIYVVDRDYAINVVEWLRRHHPDALALIRNTGFQRTAKGEDAVFGSAADEIEVTE